MDRMMTASFLIREKCSYYPISAEFMRHSNDGHIQNAFWRIQNNNNNIYCAFQQYKGYACAVDIEKCKLYIVLFEHDTNKNESTSTTT